MTDNYRNDFDFYTFLMESALKSCIDTGKKRMVIPIEVATYTEMTARFVRYEFERQARFNYKMNEHESERH